MTYNAARGLTTDELREVAVQHLLRDTEHWALIVTEADARAAIDRMYAGDDRLTREVHRHQVWATFPEQREPATIDLTEAVEVTA